LPFRWGPSILSLMIPDLVRFGHAKTCR
jgi:hypothetical protein